MEVDVPELRRASLGSTPARSTGCRAAASYNGYYVNSTDHRRSKKPFVRPIPSKPKQITADYGSETQRNPTAPMWFGDWS